MKKLDKRLEKLPLWAKKHLAEIETELAIERAMRITAKPIADMPIPQRFGEKAYGYSYNAARGRYREVFKSVSSYGSHGKDHEHRKQWEEIELTSKGGIDQYANRSTALKAMRYEVEQEAARRLAAIDRMIDEAERVEYGF